MELKGRLGLIAKKVEYCEIICDIGTDHAYIPIYLVEKCIAKKAIASDIKRGPVLKARANIEYYQMEDEIDTRIGGGLEPIHLNEIEVVVIAGMGGGMIKEILSCDMEKARKAKSLILQPMNAIEILREWLYKSGFNIYDEELVREEEKIYHVLSVQWDGSVREYEEIYYHIGEKLIEKRDPLLKAFLNKRLTQLEKILQSMDKAVSDRIEKEKYLVMREKLLKMYSHI